jgi:hypothetical protein
MTFDSAHSRYFPDMPFRHVTAIVIGAVLVFVAVLVLWSYYLIPRPPPIASSESPAPAPVASVTVEMLHVSSIVLGNPPLAVVNGKTVTEGGSLKLKRSAGVVVLRVIKIEDGVVHFTNDGQKIDARLAKSPIRDTGRQ